MGGRLIVYGATGSTGTRICRLAHQARLAPVAVGRTAQALAAVAEPLGIEYRTAQLHDLRDAFDDAAVVVNCVGPYTHFGPPILAAALAAKASYIDCSGEPRWVQHIADHFDPQARSAGVAVVPSLGGGVVTDLAVHAAAGTAGTPQRIRAAIQIIGMRPSVATMRSTVELVAGGAPIADHGHITWARPGSRHHTFTTGNGTLFSSPDAIVLSRAFPDADIELHMQPGAAGPALRALSGFWRRPRAIRGSRALLDRLSANDHAGGGGRVRATAEIDGQHGHAVTIAEADDIYEVTGHGVLAVARRLLDAVTHTGLQPAGAILGDPIAAAREIGVRVNATALGQPR